MSLLTLQNDELTVKIRSKGAEVISIVDNASSYEFMWQGSKGDWDRQAPNIFPIIGNLKEGHYTYKHQNYEIPRHGFAHEMQYTIQAVTETSATFNLKYSAETLKVYPFEFSLQVTYILYKNRLTISYEILNCSEQEDLYYFIGTHPTFNMSMNAHDFEQVSYSFDPPGSYLRFPATKEMLINRQAAKYEWVDTCQVKARDFKNNSRIYQVGAKTQVTLKDEYEQVEINILPSEMFFISLWSPYPAKAPFISVESWSGLVDTTDDSSELSEKYSVSKLAPGKMASHDITTVLSKY